MASSPRVSQAREALEEVDGNRLTPGRQPGQPGNPLSMYYEHFQELFLSREDPTQYLRALAASGKLPAAFRHLSHQLFLGLLPPKVRSTSIPCCALCYSIMFTT